MPGRYFLNEPLVELASALGAACLLDDPGPRLDAAPDEVSAVLVDRPRRLIEMRWNMIMSGRVNARGRPVMETITNARSETLFAKSAFDGVRKAVLPVSGWYEWTGKKGRKTRWRMSPANAERFLFAAIWDVWLAPGGIEVFQMATVTVEPNIDVAAYHHRMPAILDPAELEDWFDGDDDRALALLRPAEAGTVMVEPA